MDLANGAAVVTWPDSSGKGRNAGSGSNVTWRANVLNGRPVVRFANGYISIPASGAIFKFLHTTAGGTIYVVGKFGTVANPNAAYGVIGSNMGTAGYIGYAMILGRPCQ